MIRKKLSQHCSTYKKAVRTKNSFPIFSPYGFFYMCLISLSYSESELFCQNIFRLSNTNYQLAFLTPGISP